MYLGLLAENNIGALYHFTDRSNLPSIREHGAIFSWHYCETNGIPIVSGGGGLSRSLDMRIGLENFVRLSFTPNHPMMHVAMRRRIITDPVVLEIDLEVLLWKNTKFADRNAARYDAKIGHKITDFRKIQFDKIKHSDCRELAKADRPFFQAEVMVWERIPVEFIRNI